MDTNAQLRLASVWHSLHAISRKVAPVSGGGGIESLECDTFDLYCFQAETGMKIFITTTKGVVGIKSIADCEKDADVCVVERVGFRMRVGGEADSIVVHQIGVESSPL